MKEYVGMLRVSGEIDLKQFWPGGKSDADTATIRVDPNGFEFSPDPTKRPFKPTSAFESATLGGKAVIHPGRKITVRLQGIDATELHIKADYNKKLKGDREFRQFLAETATVYLRKDLLDKVSGAKIKCTVTTRVDKPDQVFDVYRRFIGDIVVTIGNKSINVNQWLVEHGWAFPAYYDSMRNDEIQALQKLGDKAKRAATAKHRPWGQLTGHVGPLDFGMVYRPNGPLITAKDVGKVLTPKIFRRQVRYVIQQFNGSFTGSFHDFFAKNKDKWIDTSKYLKNRNVKFSPNLAPLLDSNGVFTKKPDEIVFAERATAKLMAGGKPVTGWN
jgi:endonuclease YncB( thermonuclease family)